MTENKREQVVTGTILSHEQEELLDLYIQKLDSFYEELKTADKTEVVIETMHLKRILSHRKPE